MMKLKIYVIAGIALALVACSYLILKKETIREDSALIVGTASGYAPWVSMNEAGELEGFDIDVINAIATQLNKKVILQDLGSMSSLFISLDQNKIDAIIWGMSITDDRLKQVAMVHYQGEITASYPLIFWEKIPDNIKTINDMKGLTICVEPASTQYVVLSKYNFINKLSTEKVDDALLNIQYGKADAAFVEPAIANKFKNIYPQIQILEVSLDSEDQVKGVGICIKQNNAELIREIETAANALILNGTIKAFEEKWDIS